MKIYLAAPFSEIYLMRKWRTVVEISGHVCTSRWLECDPEEPWGSQEVAQIDLDDIDASDVLISHALPDSLLPRGSRHVEFGYALGKGKRLINVGAGPENIFHRLPGVVTVPDIYQAMIELQKV